MTNKRRRRTRADIDRIRFLMYRIAESEHPVTCRQLFYRMVSLGLIEKTEAEYKGTVVRLLSEMRLSNDMPFHWIADHTRWQRKPSMYSGLRQCLQETRDFYRRDLWEEQDAYCEVWCEKNALAGVLVAETDPWGVPLMISVGFASLSFLHTAAMQIMDINKPTHIFYLGDHDPSGLAVAKQIEDRLIEFTDGAVDLSFCKIAVTPEQIDEYNLPTRPTKMTDTRAKKFIGESVEVDAISPRILRKLVEESITDLIDQDILDRTRAMERAELSTFDKMNEWLVNGTT